MAFAIKAPIGDAAADTMTFAAQKTMYGGKRIAAGDTIYLFDSENAGGAGLVARGTVIAAKPVPRLPDVGRQTPRVTIAVKRTDACRRRLGRRDLKPFDTWDDGHPETELNFKLYRQATDKIVGLSDEAAAFLATRF